MAPRVGKTSKMKITTLRDAQGKDSCEQQLDCRHKKWDFLGLIYSISYSAGKHFYTDFFLFVIYENKIYNVCKEWRLHNAMQIQNSLIAKHDRTFPISANYSIAQKHFH